jgi:hypothetical protein
MKAISGKALRDKSRQYVTCPETQNTYLMRRPLMSDLIRANILPENYVAETLQNLGREVAKNTLTDKDLLEGEATQEALVTASMLEPRIVKEAEGDDEIEFRDIPASDRLYLFNWCTGRLPEVAIDGEGGESVTVGELDNFSSTEAGGEPSSSVNDSEARPQELVGAASN